MVKYWNDYYIFILFSFIIVRDGGGFFIFNFFIGIKSGGDFILIFLIRK